MTTLCLPRIFDNQTDRLTQNSVCPGPSCAKDKGGCVLCKLGNAEMWAGGLLADGETALLTTTPTQSSCPSTSCNLVVRVENRSWNWYLSFQNFLPNQPQGKARIKPSGVEGTCHLTKPPLSSLPLQRGCALTTKLAYVHMGASHWGPCSGPPTGDGPAGECQNQGAGAGPGAVVCKVPYW